MNILIVDDDPNARKTLGQILRAKGFEVEEAGTGSEAIASFGAKFFNLTLIDVRLLGSSGLEVLKAVRAHNEDTIVIMMTGHASLDSSIEAMNEGAYSYLIKPLDMDAVLAVIEKGLEKQRLSLENKRLLKELTAANEKLEELSITDPLTGALNRRGLQRALAREVAWINRYGTSLLAVLLDLDNFKKINDTHGHVAGDTILKEIVKNLRKTLRPVDYIARIGGDEFIILLAQTRLGDGFGVAEKMRFTISQTECNLKDIVVRATASLGLAQVTEERSSVEEVIRKCQHVLKNSKTLGKNRVSFSESQEDIKDGLLDQVLLAMNQSKSYRIVKQPIFRLADRSIVGYEFLTRLNAHMFEMPADFFRLSQANNMLTIVDRHCLHHCVQAGQRIERGIRRHLNLYPTTIVESSIEVILKEFPSEGREEFCVELSENLMMTDLSKILESIRIMKDRGIRIAIDDVSFGKSCLESLVILEPDVVKIDKQINVGLAKDNGRQRSLDRLLKVVRSLNAEVIVEGIESEDDLQVLCSMGVGLGQGFLLGRPE